MQSSFVMLVVLAGVGTPTELGRSSAAWGRYVVSGRKLERFAAAECMNPHFLAHTDPVRVAKFDSFGMVTLQREAAKSGYERLRTSAEYWKSTRAASSVAISGGWQQQAQQSFQRQFQFKAP